MRYILRILLAINSRNGIGKHQFLAVRSSIVLKPKTRRQGSNYDLLSRRGGRRDLVLYTSKMCTDRKESPTLAGETRRAGLSDVNMSIYCEALRSELRTWSKG